MLVSVETRTMARTTRTSHKIPSPSNTSWSRGNVTSSIFAHTVVVSTVLMTGSGCSLSPISQ